MRVGLFFDPCVHTIVNCTYRFIILLITDTFYEFKEKKKMARKIVYIKRVTNLI